MIPKSWYAPAVIAAVLSVVPARAQTYERDSLLIRYDVENPESAIDLSTLLLWGNNREPRSGFRIGTHRDDHGLSFPCISITEDAIAAAGYKPGTLQASLAIDFPFAKLLYRGNSTIIVEFDAMWESFNNQGWGESGRIVVFLLHQYPKTPPEFNAVYDIQGTTPFGRPAYNVRIRNHNRTGQYHSGGFMLYGGGHELLGEFEKYNDKYWLPGFSSEAGGGTPGLGPPYPLSPTQKNESFALASTSQWMHYTWIAAPERLELYVRRSAENAASDKLALFMEIPAGHKTTEEQLKQINDAHSTQLTQMPLMYHWFDSLAAIRVYLRGEQQTHLANLYVRHRYQEPFITGLADTSAPIRAYPNPTHGQLQLIVAVSDTTRPWQIINLLGREVAHGTIWPGTDQQEVRLENIPPGVYLLKTDANPAHPIKIVLH